MTNESRAKIPLVSYKEFKSLVNDQDGFGKTRRILYYGFDSESKTWKFRLPIVGTKESCMKVAYRLFHGQDLNYYEGSLMIHCIEEGNFKFSLSHNFQNALVVKNEVKWENNQIIDPVI